MKDSAFGVEDDPEVAALQEELAAREQEIQELEEERRQAEAVEQRKAEAAKRVFELERKLKEADTKLASLKNPSLRVAKVLVQSCTRCKFANVRMPCDLCPECSAEMSIQRGAIQTWRCGKCDMVAGKDASSCTFCEVSFDV
jgi:predicted RNase H-like nuclease (RuvC/YqgF family)